MRFGRLVFLLAVLAGSLAFAARKPQDFQDPPKMTEEDIEAAKQRSKNPLNGYSETQSEKPKDPPYALIVLAGLAFLAATPFALRAFRDTSKDIQPPKPTWGGAREE